MSSDDDFGPRDALRMLDAFAQVDAARLDRHQQLLAWWRDLPAEELLADLSVLAQLAAFKVHQSRVEAGLLTGLPPGLASREVVVAWAKESVKRGAGHDCGEWWEDGRCALCGKEQERPC